MSEELRKRIKELETELHRYRQAPNIPFIKGGSCKPDSTHNACDCIIRQLAEAKDLVHNAADENERLKKENQEHSRLIDRLTSIGLQIDSEYKEIKAMYERIDALQTLPVEPTSGEEVGHKCSQCNGHREYWNQYGKLVRCTLCSHRYINPETDSEEEAGK